MSAKKKATAKKTARKTAVKKTVSKKSPAKKTVKKVAAKKSPPKKKAAQKKASSEAPAKAASKAPAKGKGKTKEKTEEKKASVAAEEVTRRVTEALKKKNKKRTEEDIRKGQPIVFSMADLRDFLKTRKTPKEEAAPVKKATPAASALKPAKPAEPAPEVKARPKQKFGAASVADLLGFDPTAPSSKAATSKSNEEGIPKKWITYFRALVTLHGEVYEGLHRHSEETLRRSNKEDSGDLSSYGQHMADAGTDSFDRDFALSMVSSEQEALYEIDEAIRRIRNGTYGSCEITGKPISRDRLRAVPFTRYSVEGQMEVERGRVRTVQKAGIQGFDGDDAPVLTDDDSDD